MTWAEKVARVDLAVKNQFFDPGTYTPFGGSAVPDIKAAVDHGVQRIGFDSQVGVEHDEITFLKTDIATPKRGDTFNNGVDAVEFVSRITDDDHLSIWLVK